MVQTDFTVSGRRRCGDARMRCPSLRRLIASSPQSVQAPSLHVEPALGGVLSGLISYRDLTHGTPGCQVSELIPLRSLRLCVSNFVLITRSSAAVRGQIVAPARPPHPARVASNLYRCPGSDFQMSIG